MTLIFGGTTEGRLAAQMLDLLTEPYLYSTKEPVGQTITGAMIHGALDAENIMTLCKTESIRIIIDAAHPFATDLHHNIHQAATALSIPVIRMERIYTPLKEGDNIKLFRSFEEMNQKLCEMPEHQIVLTLTGVQTINRFKEAREKHTFYFRILDTHQSWKKAQQSGIDLNTIIPAPAMITIEGLLQLINRLQPTLILTKESGASGYFDIKKEAALLKDIPLWVVQRPPIYDTPHRVTSDKELLQCFLKLRKDYLKHPDQLRSGYTTGSCVTAAAAGAFTALMLSYFEKTQTISLPDEKQITLPLFDGIMTGHEASCTVIKDAGDDPDVTHGAEIGCSIKLTEQQGITFRAGVGIGTVTIPGLQLLPGEPAINPTPRKMVHQTLLNLAEQYHYKGGWEVTPFIPLGKALADRTFNPRIGVIGGLSILGTSGYVRPYSSEAFLNAILQQIKVAHHHNPQTIVLTAGKRSEQVLQPLYPQLSSTSFVHYGNSVGDTIGMCAKAGFAQIVIGMMPGKAIKLAEGHLDTHSKHYTFNAHFAADIAQLCGYANTICQTIRNMTLANAIDALIPFSENEPYYAEVLCRCFRVISEVIPSQVEIHLYLINPTDHRWIRHQTISL